MALLEIFIPTYNRPRELSKCLLSIKKTFLRLSNKNKQKVGLVIRNNSNKYHSEYKKIINLYSKFFKKKKKNIAYFEYIFTGFNIGSVNNTIGGLFSAKAKYVWFLPDDDVARFDSIPILLSSIKKYNPSFLSGGCVKKSLIKRYTSNHISNDDKKTNKILDITYDKSKIEKFLLSGNTVQAQEYVYKVEILKKFINQDSNIELINYMHPGLLAIYCLQKNYPFIRFEKSIGIFRQGNHQDAEWRHLWWKFALIDWPILSEKMYKKKWLNKNETEISKRVFTHIFRYLSWRIDILLGLNIKSKVNPWLLLKYHGYFYILALLSSPLSIIKELSKRLIK